MNNIKNKKEDSDNTEHNETDDTIDNGEQIENDSDYELTLEEQLKQSITKADENWDKYLRAVAELENVKKRAARDVEKARKYAVESFAKELLVVIDSFEMAMGSEDIELKDLVSGNKSTLLLLQNILEQFNVKIIDPHGEPFDAEYHEAMSMEVSEKLEPGLVGFRSHKNMWKLDASRLEYSNTAEKFEFSTMAFGCALGLAKSIQFLTDIGVEDIFKYNRVLADTLVDNLRSKSAVVISPDNKSRSSIMTAYFKKKDSNKIVEHLKKRKVYVSKRGKSIRFSPHLYNTIDDIENAIEQIDSILKKI